MWQRVCDWEFNKGGYNFEMDLELSFHAKLLQRGGWMGEGNECMGMAKWQGLVVATNVDPLFAAVGRIWPTFGKGGILWSRPTFRGDLCALA